MRNTHVCLSELLYTLSITIRNVVCRMQTRIMNFALIVTESQKVVFNGPITLSLPLLSFHALLSSSIFTNFLVALRPFKALPSVDIDLEILVQIHITLPIFLLFPKTATLSALDIFVLYLIMIRDQLSCFLHSKTPSEYMNKNKASVHK